MMGMDVWDLMLLAAGGYVALITLVRLMQRRQDVIIDELTEQVALEQRRLKAERKKEKRKQLREQMQQEPLPRRDAA